MIETERHTAVLIERLSALQRRALLVRIVSLSLASALAAVAAAEIAALLLGLHGRGALGLVGATAAAAIAGTVLVALWRAPSLPQVAAIVDRRQGLQACAVTALQFASDEDAVARLVVRDAATRIMGCVPADVFPLRSPSRLPWLVAGVTVTTVLLGAGLTREDGRAATSQPGGGSGAGAAGARPAGAARTAPGEPGASAAAARPPQPVNDAAAPTPSSGAAAASDAPAPPHSGSSPAAARLDSNPAPSDVSASSGQRTVEAASASRRAEGAAVHAASAEGLPAGGATGARAGGPGRGGAGLGVETGLTRTGGGVQGGSIEPGLAAAAPRTLTAVDAARYRARWDRAQAAAARDRVPPALRQYVRDYFAAIRTPGPR